MIIQPLILKITQFFIFMLLGFILAKYKILNDKSSSLLSSMCLYLFLPASLLNSFDIELNAALLKNLALSFAAAIFIHILFFIIDRIYVKLFNLNSVERASIIYTNAGNIIIPIIAATVGEKWVIFVSCFITVEQFCIWSHAIRLFKEDEKFDIKKVLFNINIIVIIIGFIMLLFGLRLPVFVKDITTPLASMVGPAGLMVAGILITKIDFAKALRDSRVYRVLILRMVISSLIATFVLKLGSALIPLPDANTIFMITLFSAVAPAAAAILQLSEIYNKDVDLSVSINVVTTIFFIVTLPIMVLLYTL